MLAAHRSVSIRVALAVVALVLVPSIGGTQARRELRVGLTAVPTAVDPSTAIEGPAAIVARHVFDTLVQYRELSTDIEPALATRWSVSPDGLAWTFTLRDNVRFHDGTPMTATDVVASFDRLLHPADAQTAAAGALLRGTPGVLKEARAPDPRSVQLILVQPYAALLTVLANPVFGVVRATTGPDGASRLVGTGAYQVVDASAGRLAIEVVPGHWSGVPRAARIVFLQVPSDDVAEAQLDARELDVWFPSTPPRRQEGALSLPGLHVGYLAMQTEREPFTRKPVRRAVAAALDPAQLAAALGRAAVPLQSVLPPGVWARREGPPIIGGTPDAVKKLLAEGGLPRGAGIKMLVPATGDLPKVGDAIQGMLGAVGLPVSPRVLSVDDARTALQSGDYDIALTEGAVVGGDPHLFLYPLSTSESASKGPRARNFSYYRNARLDDVLVRASQLSFRPERLRLYQRAQAMLAEDLPWIPLYATLNWALVRPDVRGLRLHPSGVPRLHNVVVDTAGAVR